MDLVLMNKINKGGWVAINCIPTAAHTIWGALVGKLFLSSLTAREKIKNAISVVTDNWVSTSHSSNERPPGRTA